jgi:serine/threonine-protein kinase
MAAEFSPGQHIGDYEIISILGLGGMGKVYKVRNVISDRVEAMKILLPDLTSNQSLADRFLREIRLLATLNHPNIAALRTALTFENQLVMIMEFVEGETLANRLNRAPMSTAEAVDYSDQCLGALSYAHKQNIIHRDIKPANMMLTPLGIVKLMDFGIARSSTDGALTSTGTTLGSLNYMPPEQVRGESADARSDIYSFGVSLYEMLTGKLPFQGDSQYSLMTAHLNENPPPPISIRADLPPALNEIILMAMAKDPANRFQSAEAFRAALKSVPVSALPAADTTLGPTPAVTPKPISGATTLVETPLPPRTATVAMKTPAPVPPTPVPPAAATPAPVATVPVASAPPPRPSSSSRGLWLAIGSLVGVGVLLAAGIYIPRKVRTHADQDKAMYPSTSSDTAANTAAASNAATGAPNASQASPGDGPVSVQSSFGSVAVDDKGNVAIKAPGVTVNAGADGTASVNAPGVNVSADKSGASVTAAGASVRAKTPKAPRVDAPSAPQAPPVNAAPVPSGPSPEELAKLEDESDKLGTRAAVVGQSLNTLKQQQQAAGYNLRADMAAAQERMGIYMAKGNAALQANDTANARKYFDLADGEISKLEKFLNH